ncbi:MAG TPA: peptidylprolyl isomerase [Sphingomicrobium sp.]|nr:peptidylprolyl isomerase [Sphingomicrobium sp.]
MFAKVLFAAPLMALLIAAAPAPVPAPAPAPSIEPPAQVVANPANHWFLELSSGGKIEILLRPDLAPNHVKQFQTLIRRGFYNGLTFHRVIPGFMAQGGDPKGTGEGGSDLPNIKAEFTSVPFLRGTVGAARTEDPDTANSQFFIMFVPNSSLDGNYTVIGRVISGMDSVDSIAPGEPPTEPTKIVKAYLGG